MVSHTFDERDFKLRPALFSNPSRPIHRVASTSLFRSVSTRSLLVDRGLFELSRILCVLQLQAIKQFQGLKGNVGQDGLHAGALCPAQQTQNCRIHDGM
jgi:hypothetical protein